MASSPYPENFDSATGLFAKFATDTEIWDSLKQAISVSSGFHRWQLERSFDGARLTLSLDDQVRSYLRETLETLAY